MPVNENTVNRHHQESAAVLRELTRNFKHRAQASGVRERVVEHVRVTAGRLKRVNAIEVEKLNRKKGRDYMPRKLPKGGSKRSKKATESKGKSTLQSIKERGQGRTVESVKAAKAKVKKAKESGVPQTKGKKKHACPMKMTAARKKVLRAVLDRKKPVSAQELVEEGGTGAGSIYYHLKGLQGEGVLVLAEKKGKDGCGLFSINPKKKSYVSDVLEKPGELVRAKKTKRPSSRARAKVLIAVQGSKEPITAKVAGELVGTSGEAARLQLKKLAIAGDIEIIHPGEGRTGIRYAAKGASRKAPPPGQMDGKELQLEGKDGMELHQAGKKKVETKEEKGGPAAPFPVQQRLQELEREVKELKESRPAPILIQVDGAIVRDLMAVLLNGTHAGAGG